MITEERYLGMSLVFVAVAAAIVLANRIADSFMGGSRIGSIILMLMISGFITLTVLENIFPTQKEAKKIPQKSKDTDWKIKLQGLVLFISLLVIEVIVVGFVFYRAYTSDSGRLSEMLYLTVLFLSMIHGIIAYLHPETFIPLWRMILSDKHSRLTEKHMTQLIRDEGTAMIVITLILILGDYIGLSPLGGL
jgi:hypothetical protein